MARQRRNNISKRIRPRPGAGLGAFRPSAALQLLAPVLAMNRRSSWASLNPFRPARRRGRFAFTSALGLGLGLLLNKAWQWSRGISLRDKTVLITGGSRGLGLCLAREFARHGARLVIAARDIEELSRAQHELENMGAEVLAVPCDVTQKAQLDELVSQARSRFREIHILVNNAGVIQVGPLDTMTEEDFAHAMDVHFWAPFHLTMAVLPEMRARGEGRIVNISSIGGLISPPHLLPYNASKFALTGLSEGLYAELLKDGVRVTTVCPGLMRTGSPENALFKGRHRDEYTWFVLFDALPVTSMSAKRAARRIVAACRRGESRVILGIQAKAIYLLHNLFPGLFLRSMGLMNRLLPEPGGIGQEALPGHESATPISRSWLTHLSLRASRRNNELQPNGRV